MKTIKDYWAQITFLLAGLGVAVVWIAEIDSKTFENPEQKVIVTTYVKNAPSPKDIWRKYYADSLKIVYDKKHDREMDSILQMEIKRNKYRDSIALLNADQIFQTKEVIKALVTEFRQVRNNR
jgi:hypothetical protein